MGKQSIEATRGTHFLMDPDDIVIVGLDTEDGTEHPLYDPRIDRPLTEEEVNNTRFYGVLKPVLARKNGDKVELVDGRSRVRRARAVKAIQVAAGEETIKVPVLIKKGDDAHLFGVSRAANIQIADGPMTNAKNAQKLIDMGKSLGEVATTFGVTEQTIRNWTMQLDLAPEVVQAVIKQEISGTAAMQLASLPKADQVATLTEIKEETKATGAKPTVEKVRRKVNEKAGKTGNTPKEKIERARNLLVKFTGSTKTKEDAVNTLERISRVLLGMGLDKLANEEE